MDREIRASTRIRKNQSGKGRRVADFSTLGALARLTAEDYQRLRRGYHTRGPSAANGLSAYGDRLQLEMAASQERGRSDKFAGRKILGGEVSTINRIEFVEQR